MDLKTLKREQPALIENLLKDYPPQRACELANRILKSLDDLEHIDEGYTVTRTNGHFDVKKNDDRLAERVRAKVRGMAGLR